MPNDGKQDDLRLIEDYLPIEAISAEASREKSVRKGHISTLHLWWARRPLVACRAAVYGALVSADRWVRELDVKNPAADSAKAEAFKNGAKRGLNRKAAKEFVTKLCRYPKTKPTKPQDIKVKRETEAAIVEAQRHILEAHAERLTAELAEASTSGKPPAWVKEFKFQGDKVTYDDIIAGRAPRPRVLDMFAGGGAIPLEALRLGCEAYALDLNPVAHIIQLCTLVYPQKYGKPDPAARGMTGPKNGKAETTWGGLAAEVRYWGNWVLDRVRKEIGDLYPPIPDPVLWKSPPEIAFDRETGEWKVTEPGKLKRGVKLDALSAASTKQPAMYEAEEDEDSDDEAALASAGPIPGFLQPVAYIWTRTVRCKNPSCGASIPLVKHTWLCDKKGRRIAARPAPKKSLKQVLFSIGVVDEGVKDWDPSAGSEGGSIACPFCSAVADANYVQDQGQRKLTATQPIAAVCVRPGKKGKLYLSADRNLVPEPVAGRLEATAEACALKVPTEPINSLRPSPNARGLSPVTRHGMTSFRDLFTSRQLVVLMTFLKVLKEMSSINSDEYGRVVTAFAGIALDKVLNRFSTFCPWDSSRESVVLAFGKHMLPMVWDFAEPNVVVNTSGSWQSALSDILATILALAPTGVPATCSRGTALSASSYVPRCDAIVTDPPYYDNIPYADISDFYYVWLKRSVGELFREHFGTELTPKKSEATALSSRHGGNMDVAKAEYEEMMQESFRQAHRILVPGGPLIIVYAHKTTLGWSTLVNALRRAGFVVVEAWPIDTEYSGHRKSDTASLASSIFLVARTRLESVVVGNYEDDVQPDLQQIVRERVETLWDMGIAGADLVIACVGAGLRAFTKYEKVEYANGEEVPAEKFLAEVEGAVLDRMMEKLFGQSGGKVSAIDSASRFYVLWRFVYKASEIDAGEAIVFTYAQHVELDGPLGLSAGRDALVEKKKAKYRARDYTERGDNDKLGLPDDDGKRASLIDVLHRVLWLMEHSPRKLREFLLEASADRERLRVLAQALGGAALSGKTEEDAEKLIGTTPAEKTALGKLLANWRSVIENVIESREERAERERGEKRLFE